MNLDIQRVDRQSADDLRDLFRRCAGTEVTRTFRAFPLDDEQATAIAELEGQDVYLLAVDDERRAVGLAMLRGWDEGYEIPSFGIFVDPERHGRGVARRLLDACIAEADARRSPRIRLTVDRDNPRAKSIYEHAGFVEAVDESDALRAVMFREMQ